MCLGPRERSRPIARCGRRPSGRSPISDPRCRFRSAVRVPANRRRRPGQAVFGHPIGRRPAPRPPEQDPEPGPGAQACRDDGPNRCKRRAAGHGGARPRRVLQSRSPASTSGSRSQTPIARLLPERRWLHPPTTPPPVNPKTMSLPHWAPPRVNLDGSVLWLRLFVVARSSESLVLSGVLVLDRARDDSSDGWMTIAGERGRHRVDAGRGSRRSISGFPVPARRQARGCRASGSRRVGGSRPRSLERLRPSSSPRPIGSRSPR